MVDTGYIDTLKNGQSEQSNTTLKRKRDQHGEDGETILLAPCLTLCNTVRPHDPLALPIAVLTPWPRANVSVIALIMVKPLSA
jgi:hypothetical protein